MSEKRTQAYEGKKEQEISQYYDAFYTNNQQFYIFKLNILLQNFSHDTKLKTLLFSENTQNKGLDNGLVQFIEGTFSFTLKCIAVVVVAVAAVV